MSFTRLNSERLASATDLPQLLAAALADRRRHSIAGRRMSPELSYGRHAGPAPPTARHAAVLLLLFRRDGRWHLPVTERPLSLTRHGGQISLPGGLIEPEETSQQAAIRELREELGIDSPLEVLGQLADCYVFASNFVVTPWLAISDDELHWKPDPREVAQVVELPVEVILDSAMDDRMTIRRGPLEFGAPCYRLGDCCIWGATGVILGELAELLEPLLDERGQHDAG